MGRIVMFMSRAKLRSLGKQLTFLLIALSVASAAIADGSILFWPARLDFAVGDKPSAIAISDVNGDE